MSSWNTPKASGPFRRSRQERWGTPPRSLWNCREGCIELYTYANDVVLDPFMGSGSTGIAARSTGRRYVGYDTSEEYCNAAMERLEAVCPVSIRTARSEGSHASRPDNHEPWWAPGTDTGFRQRRNLSTACKRWQLLLNDLLFKDVAGRLGHGKLSDLANARCLCWPSSSPSSPAASQSQRGRRYGLRGAAPAVRGLQQFEPVHYWITGHIHSVRRYGTDSPGRHD